MALKIYSLLISPCEIRFNIILAPQSSLLLSGLSSLSKVACYFRDFLSLRKESKSGKTSNFYSSVV
jgi:hypothetical protein